MNYLEYVKPLMGTDIPVGIYSGGPNEQGYSNIYTNQNLHNTGNHRVQDSKQEYSFMNKMPYNEFPYAYNGNLIYDINNYLFGREPILSSELKNFGIYIGG